MTANFTIRNVPVASCYLAILASLANGCGAGFTLPGKKTSSASAGASATTVDAAFLVTQTTGVALNDLRLADSSLSYAAAISGCASGYTKSIAPSATSVAVPIGDTNCLAKLSAVSETFAGSATPVSFNIDPGFSWTQGAQYVALDAASGRRMVLTVVSQLPSPILAASAPAISFTVDFLDGSAATATAAAVSAAVDLAVDAPVSLEVAKIALVADSSGGATNGDGAFSLSLNCLGLVTGAAMKCDGLSLTNFQSAIGADSYVDAASNPRDLTLAECTALASNGSKPVAGQTYYQYAQGNAATNVDVPNGGFVIKADGPGQMCAAANTKLVLAINNTGGRSCKYWRLSVTCP